MKQFKVVSLYFFLIVNLFSSLGVNAKSIVAADIVEGQQHVPNFLKQKGHFEKNANGTSAYADAAGTRPVDGTGGAPTLTCTRTTSSPIDGDGSLLITKGASNLQGNGCTIQFTIDSAYKAKVLQIEFDYLVASGTFTAGSSSADSDLIAYIYDVTNSTLIEPSSIKLLSNSTTIADHFVANFQTSATGTTYNLILHQATTSASAYTVKADNFQVKPSQYVYGTPITDWVAYTPTGSWSTNTTYTGRWRRVGDTLESQINLLLAGAPTAADLTVNFLPAGLSVDSAKMAAFSFGSVGDANIIDSGTRVYIANPAFNGGSSVYLVHTESGNTGIVNATNPTTFASADNVRMNLRFPITGWSSSVQVSDGYDGRSIGFRANNSSTSISATPAKVVWTNTDKDDVAGYSSGTYSVKKAGWYDVAASLYLAGTPSVDQTAIIYIYRNGASVKDYTHRYKVASATTTSVSISDSYYFLAGDTIEIYAMSEATTPTISSSTTKNIFTVNMRQSPTTISATEVVAASYNCDTGQTLTSAATIKFNSKVVDTHNAYNTTTGVFTAPHSGLYEISGQLLSINATSEWTPAIRKNNSGVIRTAPSPVFNTGTTINNNQSEARFSSYIVQLNAGEVLDFYNTVGLGVGTLYASSSDNYMSIKRIK